MQKMSLWGLVSSKPSHSLYITFYKTTHTSCHTGCYCGSQGSQLGETIGDFSFPAACMSPSGTVRASQQGGSFMIGTYLISPCPVTCVSLFVCFFFPEIGSVFPSSSGGHPRAMTIICFGYLGYLLFIFSYRVSCSPDCPLTHCVAEVSLEFQSLMLSPSK